MVKESSFSGQTWQQPLGPVPVPSSPARCPAQHPQSRCRLRGKAQTPAAGLVGAIGPGAGASRWQCGPRRCHRHRGQGQELGARGVGHPSLGIPGLSREPLRCPRVFWGCFRLGVLLVLVGEQGGTRRGACSGGGNRDLGWGLFAFPALLFAAVPQFPCSGRAVRQQGHPGGARGSCRWARGRPAAAPGWAPGAGTCEPEPAQV